jgi:hypothetical protein
VFPRTSAHVTSPLRDKEKRAKCGRRGFATRE